MPSVPKTNPSACVGLPPPTLIMARTGSWAGGFSQWFRIGSIRPSRGVETKNATSRFLQKSQYSAVDRNPFRLVTSITLRSLRSATQCAAVSMRSAFAGKSSRYRRNPKQLPEPLGSISDRKTVRCSSMRWPAFCWALIPAEAKRRRVIVRKIRSDRT